MVTSMNSRYVSSAGRQLQLGAKIGTGGEGAVYELAGSPDQVVKIYHKVPQPEHARKLQAMASICDRKLEQISAWPSETVSKQNNGQIIGTVMKRLAHDFREVINLYSPLDRKKYFPSADFAFLVHTSYNLAAAFDTMHKAGVVVGDVNQKNILVNPQAFIRLIDCDSFQVYRNNELFRCRVGVPEYTPPELHGKNFSSVDRDQNHDNFGLAVIIFSLLMMGRHPFAGVSTGPSALDLQQAIQGYHFAYSVFKKSGVLLPPPNSPPLDILPINLIRLFERAFSQDGAQKKDRPKPQEWLTALEEFRSSILGCKKNGGHKFGQHLSSCPWCELESRSIIYFTILPGSNSASSSRTATFASGPFSISINNTLASELKSLIARYKSMAAPSQPASYTVLATPLPAGALAARKILTSLRICLVLLVGAMILGWTGYVGFVVLAMLFAWWLCEESENNEYKKEITRRRKIYQKADADMNTLLSGIATFMQNKQALCGNFTHTEKLLTEYEGLPARLESEKAKLEADKRTVQERVFLQRFTIETGTIMNFGPNRKAVLRSFGIYTAADIDANVIAAIPGIGSSLAQNLVDWQSSLLTRFNFNPNEPVPPSELAALHSRISARANILETELNSRSWQLSPALARLENLRHGVNVRIQQQADVLAHAKADLEV